MSYKVLARKWRPKTFSDVIGQEHVLKTLENSLLLKKIHHSYLLSGSRGIGKTTIARLLVKGLSCESGITPTPCNQCNNCNTIDQGRFIDLLEIDAASRTKVEDTRDLLDTVQYAPIRGRFKVYLIDEAHMLSRHSFNALLKTLEEPPSHVKFLLATTDPQKLPITIISRCLQFNLKTLNTAQICSQLCLILKKENIFFVPNVISLLAQAAHGSMRDALNLVDQAVAMGKGKINTDIVNTIIGSIDIEQPLALIETLNNSDGKTMIACLAKYADRGVSWDDLLAEMLNILHHIALSQIEPNKLNEEEDSTYLQRLRELSRKMLPEALQLYYQTILTGRKELPFAPDPRIGVEMTLLRAMMLQQSKITMNDIANIKITKS